LARASVKATVVDYLETISGLNVYDKPYRLVTVPKYPCACVVVLGSGRTQEQKSRANEEMDIAIGLFLHPMKKPSDGDPDLDDLIDEVEALFCTQDAMQELQILSDEGEPMVTADPVWTAIDSEGGDMIWSAIVTFTARRVETT